MLTRMPSLRDKHLKTLSKMTNEDIKEEINKTKKVEKKKKKNDE